MRTLIGEVAARMLGRVGVVVDDRHPVWSGFRSGLALGVVLIALVVGVVL